ncbi:MAG: NAD(P)H-binding protein [Porticoccaceae bacterium]|nr:NAD(P)H-binding protein [Porticoccaceae bacterium]
MRALLIGFGDLAQRLAPQLLAAGWQVRGLRRSPADFPGVEMLRGDCRDVDAVASALADQDLVIITLTPAAFTAEAYQHAYVDSAEAICAALKRRKGRGESLPRQIIWVSSTSVFGAGQGEWVNEGSETNPASFSGGCLLAAEQAVAAAAVPATVVRFSGIYGGDSTRMLDQVRAGRCAPAQPVQWSNRIHREDCVGILNHLAAWVEQGKILAPLYLATDCEPAPLHEVHRWLAEQLKVPFQVAEGGAVTRGNRRCSNQLLLASGYRFIHPTFREGYAQLIADS